MFSTNHNLLFKATILALCVISLMHVFISPLYKVDNGQWKTLKTFKDIERSLCVFNVRQRRRVWVKSKCPEDGIVTAIQGGRLGNQMWEYAAVWAVARRTGLEPYIPRCFRVRLEQVFAALSVPSLEEIYHCPTDVSRFVTSFDAWNYTNQNIILPKYFTKPELVIPWVQDIVQEFTIKPILLHRSQQILRHATKNSTAIDNITFVGVHVRRTDYVHFLKRKFAAFPANVTFYEAAMDYFESKYDNVVFVMVSDDPQWCISKFSARKTVYINKQRNAPGLDMALLASCNHTILDYGTFGQWSAILAGGETIYYNLSQHSTARIGQLLPNWHTI